MSEEIKTKDVITQSGFAKLCGVSPEAVRKAIVAGKIGAIGEGRKKRILLADLNTVAYLNDRNSQRKKSVKPQSDNVSAPISIPDKHPQVQPSPTDTPKASSPSNTLKMIDLDDEDIDISSFSQNDIKKVKDLETARKNAQDRKKSRGDLIDRKLVTTILGKIYTIEVNQIKPIADKSPSRIAAIFEDEDPEKILKVSQILSSDISDALNHIKHNVERFLNQINKNSKEKRNVLI